VNSTSITRFHRHLPHHLHGEVGNRRRKRGSNRKNEKRTEGVEIKRKEQKEFLFVNCEKRKEKESRTEKVGKRREENRKKQGKRGQNQCGHCFFSPELVTTGRVQKLQCHLLRLFQRQDLQNRREDRKAKTNREKGTKTQS